MKYLTIILSLFLLTSCLSFRAKKSAKKEHPITKCEKKFNKLVSPKKCPELLKSDTIYLDTTSTTIKAELEYDTASTNKQIANALERFKLTIDSISNDCDSLLNSFSATLTTAGTIVYQCKLKSPVYVSSKLETNRGDIYFNASIYQIGNEILTTIRIDSSNLTAPIAVNTVPEKETLRLSHEKGYEQGALKYEGKFKTWRKIGIGLFILILLLVGGFALGKHYRLI